MKVLIKLLTLALACLLMCGTLIACQKPGKSAYDLAVEAGFVGTQEEWLTSLHGKSAYDLAVEAGFVGTREAWLAALQGKTEQKNLGNLFDNKLDGEGYIDPYTGEEKSADGLKYSSAYYPFNAGTLYFEATKACETVVFVIYNAQKEFVTYQSFNGVTSAICAFGFDGFFRCYVDGTFDGELYFSTNVPTSPVDYSYSLTYVAPKEGRRLTIVNLGDSVFGNVQNGTSVSGALQALRDDTVYNFAFGGSLMCNFKKEPGWENFSFYSLADAICTGDYSAQWEQLNSDTYYPSYFHTTIAAMQTMDWSKVDVITVAFGTNDYNKEGLLTGDPFDVDYYTGAFQYGVKRLQETYPHIRIIAITPIMRFLDNKLNADDHDECGNGTLRDFATALQQTATLMRIPVIDAFTELSLSEYNKDFYYQVDDGAHLNARGRRMFAALISAYIDLYCTDLLSKRPADIQGD